MRALLIDPENRSIENVEIQRREDIAQLIGYDTLESDEIGPEGDRLFFDEECFLRGTSGRFQIDRVVPVSGKSVVVGASADGTELRDVHSSADDIRARLKYL
jgi:lipase chaperone LimK